MPARYLLAVAEKMSAKEQVVNYDVRKLRYIRRKHQIELWGNIPIRISLKLKMQWKLCLEAVSETGNQ